MPDLVVAARFPVPAGSKAGAVFASPGTHPPVGLPSGIAYAELPYRPEPTGDEALAERRLLPALPAPDPDAVVAASPKRQAEHLAGRLCARAAVYQVTGMVTTIGRTASGAPVWPGGVTGSISHSQGRAVAVAARRADWGTLGIDIEAQLPAVTAGELAPLILTIRERERFAHVIDPGFLTMAFSMKEALFKALHPLVNRFFDHHGAQLLDYDPCGTATLRLTQDLSDDWRQGRRVTGRFWRPAGRCMTLVWTGGSDDMVQNAW